MKKFFLSSILVFCSLSGFANEPVNSKKEDFTTKAFELLTKNQNKIKLTGDVAPNEKLKPILDDLGEFVTEHLFAVMAGDEPDYKGHLINFNADCKEPLLANSVTKCELMLEYKPLGDTLIVFEVKSDKDGNPVSILKNQADVLRGG